MDFIELLQLPNNTNLTYKHSNYKKENKRSEVKKPIRVKKEESRGDYFMRVLKKVKLSVTNILNAEEKKE
jgi:hypothetical protein